MKKISRLTALIFLGLQFCPGIGAPLEKDGKYLGGGLGIDVPVQGGDPIYPAGIGGKGIFGYLFSDDLAVELTVDGFLWPGDLNKSGGVLTNITDFRFIPQVKVYAEGSGSRPYFFAGAGLDVSSVNFVFYSNVATNPVLLAGAGWLFDLDPKTWLFIEGRYDLILTNVGSSQDIPFQAGLLFAL